VVDEKRGIAFRATVSSDIVYYSSAELYRGAVSCGDSATQNQMRIGQQGGRREAVTEIDGHIRKAVRAATKDLRQLIMDEGDLNDWIAAQIKV
jgi:hypothetical protein